MEHLKLLITVLSFSIGIAALVMYTIFGAVNGSRLAKSFAALQGLITFCVFLNSIYTYIQAALRGSTALLVAWYGVDYFWAGFYFYYYALFFFNLTGTHFIPRRKLLYKVVATAICLTGILPYLSGGGMEAIAARLDWQSSWILVPSGMIATVIATAAEILSYRKIANEKVRAILRLDFGFKAILIPSMVFAFMVNSAHEELQSEWMYTIRNIYFLAWNVASVVLAARFALQRGGAMFKEAEAVGSDLGAATRALGESIGGYERASLDREEAAFDLRRIDRAIRRDKPYLDPEISLPSLAESLKLSRNRLSQLVNEGLGKNFRDFINEYRVEEAKRLLREGSLGVLDVAYEAGFNSKATFYTAFKKTTGMTPSEYRGEPRPTLETAVRALR